MFILKCTSLTFLCTSRTQIMYLNTCIQILCIPFKLCYSWYHFNSIYFKLLLINKSKMLSYFFFFLHYLNIYFNLNVQWIFCRKQKSLIYLKKIKDDFMFFIIIESTIVHNGGGLWPNRNIGAHRTSCAGMQLEWHWASTLERHAGQPAQTHRSVAHLTGSSREKLKT